MARVVEEVKVVLSTNVILNHNQLLSLTNCLTEEHEQEKEEI